MNQQGPHQTHMALFPLGAIQDDVIGTATMDVRHDRMPWSIAVICAGKEADRCAS